MSYQTCSTFVKVGLCVNVLALLFTAVAIFTPHWLINDLIKTQLGLFYKCTDGVCETADPDGDTKPQAWQVAVFAVEIVGLLFALFSLVFAIFLVFIPRTSGKRWVQLTSLALAFAAAVMVLTGAGVCGAKREDFPEIFPGFRPSFDISWSFALAVIGGLLYFAAGLVFMLDILCT